MADYEPVTLDVDPDMRTIMGGHFDEPEIFESVWYAISSSVFEE